MNAVVTANNNSSKCRSWSFKKCNSEQVLRLIVLACGMMHTQHYNSSSRWAAVALSPNSLVACPTSLQSHCNLSNRGNNAVMFQSTRKISYPKGSVRTSSSIAAATTKAGSSVRERFCDDVEQQKGTHGARSPLAIDVCDSFTNRNSPEVKQKSKFPRKWTYIGGLLVVVVAGSAAAVFSSITSTAIAASSTSSAVAIASPQSGIISTGISGFIPISLSLMTLQDVLTSKTVLQANLLPFLKQKVLPSGLETLQKMLLMEMWRRVWTNVWEQVSKMNRWVSVYFWWRNLCPPAENNILGGICRFKEFMDATVVRGAKKLLQKRVQESVKKRWSVISSSTLASVSWLCGDNCARILQWWGSSEWATPSETVGATMMA